MLSTSNADFRLYEFLKNSLLIEDRSIQKQSLQDCFCIELSSAEPVIVALLRALFFGGG